MNYSICHSTFGGRDKCTGVLTQQKEATLRQRVRNNQSVQEPNGAGDILCHASYGQITLCLRLLEGAHTTKATVLYRTSLAHWP